MKFFTFTVSLLVCFLFSCQQKNIPQQTKQSTFDSTAYNALKDSIEVIKKRRITPNQLKFNRLLEKENSEEITSPSKLIFFGKDSIRLDSLTLNVYKANGNKAFWTDSSKCKQIIRVLHQSKYDGLKPTDYGIPELDSLFKKCFVPRKKKNDTLYWKLELSLTYHYLRYLKHLRYGKTNPETIYKDWDYTMDKPILPTHNELAKALTRNPDTLVNSYMPQYSIYRVLRATLIKADSIEEIPSYEWSTIAYPGRELKQGDTSWVIPKIKHRLLSVGIGHEDSSSTTFDKDLRTSLDYFQQHVGLTPNGTIDKATIQKLNFTPQEIKEVVSVNMERCRWLPMGGLPDHYILVNIADYTLRIFKNNKQVYKTKVVVGATNKETPVFHSKLTTVELNPHWTVPVSISKNELLPKLQADSEYLTRNNMELLKGDSVVQITDFSSYSKNNFPFVIRQKPGDGNSLGLVKFLFPNPYSVYLHDTPSKSLFEKDVRAFSHGCVRVYKPLDLAAFLLADQGLSPKYIDEVIKSGVNTPIGLKTKIPIIITYWTCTIDENNQVNFFKDIYGRDKLILKSLNE